jgi:hypothetical protein
MKDTVWGMLFGASVALAIFGNVGVVDQHRKLKQECEKNLPRNQVCIMKLVPQGE